VGVVAVISSIHQFSEKNFVLGFVYLIFGIAFFAFIKKVSNFKGEDGKENE
jgi:hypothetical protein